MNAIVCPTCGSPDVLEFRDVAKPSPKDDEVLIRVHAAGVNAGDWHLMRADTLSYLCAAFSAVASLQVLPQPQ